MLFDDQFCADFIETLRGRRTCDWCKHPREPVRPRIGLCDHCNRIRLGLKKLEREATVFIQQHGGLTWTMIHALRIQRKMIDGAKIEGRRYGNIYDDDLRPVKLEHELSSFSEAICGKDFFYGWTNSLNWSLSINQRRYLYYILSLMIRERMRNGRRRAAMWAVTQEILDEPAGPRPPIIGQLL